MRRSLSLVAALLVLIVPLGCGGQEKGGQGGKKKGKFVPVGMVLKQGERLGTPTVRARAFAIERTTLVLAGKMKSVVALGSPAVVGKARQPGRPVIANGPVRRLTPQQAKELERDFAKLSRGKDTARVPPDVTRAPRKPGTPYLAVERIQPAGGGGKGPGKGTGKQGPQKP